MSELASHIRGYRETVEAKRREQNARATEAWDAIRSEKQALEERTARLRALRLASRV